MPGIRRKLEESGLKYRGIIPDFTVGHFKEFIDNKILVLYLLGSSIWIVYSSLVMISIAQNPEFIPIGVMNIILFSFMICIPFILFVAAKVLAFDFKEGWHPLRYMMFVPIALALMMFLYVAISTVWSSYFDIKVTSLWSVVTTPLPTDLHGTYGSVYISFMSLSESLKSFGIQLSTTKMYDIGQNIFLVAPGEELFFRGMVPYVLTKFLKTPWIAGVASNGGWALLHLVLSYKGPGSFMYVFTAFVSGFIFLYTMVYSMDITVPIITHAIYNSMIVLIGT